MRVGTTTTFDSTDAKYKIHQKNKYEFPNEVGHSRFQHPALTAGSAADSRRLERQNIKSKFKTFAVPELKNQQPMGLQVNKTKSTACLE
jgi:hypothetical protein